MAWSWKEEMISSSMQGDALDRDLHAKWIRWVAPAAVAGSRCLLKSTAGAVLLDAYADGANYIDIIPIYGPVRGLNLEVLDTGTVYVRIG